MIVPAGIYWGGAVLSGHPELTRGWAIPCATDIAFSYLVARLIFPERHPAIPFLLLSRRQNAPADTVEPTDVPGVAKPA